MLRINKGGAGNGWKEEWRREGNEGSLGGKDRRKGRKGRIGKVRE